MAGRPQVGHTGGYLTTVPKALLTERITELPEPRRDELCLALRAATGC